MGINEQIPLSAGPAGAATIDHRLPAGIDHKLPMQVEAFKPIDVMAGQARAYQLADGIEQFSERQAARLESQRTRETKERDRTLLQQYQDSGGELHTSDGMQLALKELSGKLSVESMEGLAKRLSTQRSSEVKDRESIGKLKDADLDLIHRQSEDTGKMLDRALTVYDDTLKETNDPQAAETAYNETKLALIEQAKTVMSPTTSKPVYNVEELEKFGTMPVGQLRSLVKNSKWRVDALKAESAARLRDAQVDNYESLDTKRKADVANNKAREARLRDAIAAKKGQPLDPETVDTLAEAYRVHGNKAFYGMRLTPTQISSVINSASDLNKGQGIDARDGATAPLAIKADTKSVEKMVSQYDNITAFEKTAENIGMQLVEIAKKVDDTGVPVIERWTRAGKKAVLGDTDMMEFDARMRTFRTEMARIITQPDLKGVLSDTARKEIDDILPGASTAEQIERSVLTLINEGQTRRKYLDEQIKTAKQRIRDGAKKKDVPAAPSSANDPAMQIDPADQVERDKKRLDILEEELSQLQYALSEATDEAEKTRIKGDIDAIGTEIESTMERANKNSAKLSQPKPAPQAAAKPKIINW